MKELKVKSELRDRYITLEYQGKIYTLGYEYIEAVENILINASKDIPNNLEFTKMTDKIVDEYNVDREKARLLASLCIEEVMTEIFDNDIF